jgi:hypothetical protein
MMDIEVILVCQKRNPKPIKTAIAIIKKRIVQTGAKSQFGGAKEEGLFKN